VDSAESKVRSWRVIVALIAALLLGAATTAQAAHSCALASSLSAPAVKAASAANQAKDVHCLLCASSHVQALPSARPLVEPPFADVSKPSARAISQNLSAYWFSLYIRPPPAN
jgi:hypothetical protein